MPLRVACVLLVLITLARAAPVALSSTLSASVSAASLPLCPLAGQCQFIYDLVLDFTAHQTLMFDGWIGADEQRFSHFVENTVNLYDCVVLGADALQIAAQQSYTGGYLRIEWTFDGLATPPNCSQPAQWSSVPPISAVLRGQLPDGTLLSQLVTATQQVSSESSGSFDEVHIAAPGSDLCVDALARISGAGTPAITGCPASGDCVMHVLAGVTATSLSLKYLDILVGPQRASLIGSQTISLAGATVVCQSQSTQLTVGALPGVSISWQLNANCVTAKSDFVGTGSSTMQTLVLNDPGTLGSYSASGGATGFANNTVQQSAVVCPAVYSTTPSQTPSNTPTRSLSRTPTPTASTTRTPSPTGTPTASVTRTPSQTGTQTSSPTPTSSPSSSQTGTPSTTSTATMAPTPSLSVASTATPTRPPSATPAPSASHNSLLSSSVITAGTNRRCASMNRNTAANQRCLAGRR